MISAIITILKDPLMLRWEEETQDRGTAMSTQLDSVEAEAWIQVIRLPSHRGPRWATAGDQCAERSLRERSGTKSMVVGS